MEHIQRLSAKKGLKMAKTISRSINKLVKDIKTSGFSILVSTIVISVCFFGSVAAKAQTSMPPLPIPLMASQIEPVTIIAPNYVCAPYIPGSSAPKVTSNSAQALITQAVSLVPLDYVDTICGAVVPTIQPVCIAPTFQDGAQGSSPEEGNATCAATFTLVDKTDPSQPPIGTFPVSTDITWTCATSGGQYNQNDGGCGPANQTTSSLNNGTCCGAVTQGQTPMVAEPINSATGNLTQSDTDYTGGGAFPLVMARTYNSAVQTRLPISDFMPFNWRLNYDRKIVFYTKTDGTTAVNAERPDGKIFAFGKNTDGSWSTTTNINAKLTEQDDASGVLTGWSYYSAENDEVEQYDALGRLNWIQNRAGLKQTMTRDAVGRVVAISDPFGRSLSFVYDNMTGRVATVTLPDGGVISYAYTASSTNQASLLSSIQYQDGHTKTLVYNESDLLDGYSTTTTNLLTGVVDENNNRFETYSYTGPNGGPDGPYSYMGWANNNFQGNGVNQTHLSYQSTSSDPSSVSMPPATTVTDAYGTARPYNFNTASVKYDVTSISQPSAGSTPAAVMSSAYDANGNLASQTDFNGNLTCYAYDLTRNLETVRIEGFSPGSVCPENLASYQSIPAPGVVQRKTTTQWHPTWRLPIKIAGPKRVDTLSYDTTGNVSSAIAQATDDETGMMGFSANPVGSARTWLVQSNADGQVVQITGPRTDISQISHFSYYPTTSTAVPPSYQKGDMASVSNALGQTTTFDAYDGSGRLLQSTNQNGLKTNFTYTPRGWVSSITKTTSDGADSQTASLSYDFVGDLTKATLPDGTWISQTFDSAHRLVGQEDSAGDTSVFTLDNAGNITATQISNPNAGLAYQNSKVYDALGQLISATGLPGETSLWTYDAAGNALTQTDPLENQTGVNFDALNRPYFIRLPAPGPHQNAPGIQAFLDLRDQLSSLVDPRHLTTTNNVDGLGNISASKSPDSGKTIASYDLAGNLSSISDARGKTATFTYDALDRPTLATYQSGVPSVFEYDGGTSPTPTASGHLTRISDESGQTAFSYDEFGHLIGLAQTTTSAATQSSTQSIGWSYGGSGGVNGKITTMSLPSGVVLSYTYDVAGRIASISMTQPPSLGGAKTTIISNVAWTAAGQANAWTWGNGSSFSRQFDLDGRLIQYPLGVLAASGSLAATPGALSRSVSRDLAGRIIAYSHVDSSGSSTSAAALAANQTFSSDGLSRLASFSPTATAPNSASETYGYDLSGNRTVMTNGSNSYGFSINSISNRLAVVAGSASNQSFSYDPSGNLLSDGVNSWTYSDRGRMAGSLNGNGESWRYFYSATGQRTLKEGPSGAAIRYVRDPQGRLIGEYDSSGNAVEEIVWLENTPLAVLKPPASGLVGLQIGYVFADQVNAPREVVSATDNSALWVWTQTDPFSRHQPNENPSGAGVYTFDYRLPGQIHDAETGLDHNGARDYDAAIGRFAQPDPTGLAGGVNEYNFVDSNPLIKKDVNGTDIWIENRSREDEISFHQKLSIGDPNGAYVSYTWGAVKVTVDENFPLEGNSYPDTNVVHPNANNAGSIYAYKKTIDPAAEAAFAAKIRLGLSATPGRYGPTNNCRTWSRRMFDEAPGIEMTPPVRPYAPSVISTEIFQKYISSLTAPVIQVDPEFYGLPKFSP